MQPFETEGARYIKAAHDIRSAWGSLAVGVIFCCIALVCNQTGRIWDRWGLITRSENPKWFRWEVVSLFVSAVGLIIYSAFQLLTLPSPGMKP